MIDVAMFSSNGEAEDAGEKLIAEGISPQLVGRVGRGGSIHLLVPDDDAERARKILDVPSEPEPEARLPFHPCPSCGTADPIWLGKWKLVVFASFVGVLVYVRDSALFPYAAVFAVVVFGMAVAFMPEFQCRNCGLRWSKESR
jgi:hypothetical protein